MLPRLGPRRVTLSASFLLLSLLFAVAFAPSAAAQGASQGVTPGSLNAFGARLHPRVAAVVERLRQGSATPEATEAVFVRDGKAELRIWLTEKSLAVLAQLKGLGFELTLDAQMSGLVIGLLPVEKLTALADIRAVRDVAPQDSQK